MLKRLWLILGPVFCALVMVVLLFFFYPIEKKHGVDVAQAAGTGFDVRFEQRAGALLFVVPLLHFEQFAFDKGGGVALGV